MLGKGTAKQTERSLKGKGDGDFTRVAVMERFGATEAIPPS